MVSVYIGVDTDAAAAGPGRLDTGAPADEDTCCGICR